MNKTVTAGRSITQEAQHEQVTQARLNEVVDVLAEELGSNALIDMLISNLGDKAITVLTDIAEEIGLGQEVQDHLRADGEEQEHFKVV
ncbi:hypothetical protein PH235_10585 [Trichococcus sp. K1Tr]|uniref:hypothetical protein n=1 Tax=Trichococcus sp. K1Tr TaxID=3020847 RepID=UPI00232C92D0|nr:hypothetical protein [Trichococcus sp. K1Tr]MDB6354005.1 hypothetical protein [Trichococcus sp. K1Tr]